jgi:hypothetical protein
MTVAPDADQLSEAVALWHTQRGTGLADIVPYSGGPYHLLATNGTPSTWRHPFDVAYEFFGVIALTNVGQSAPDAGAEQIAIYVLPQVVYDDLRRWAGTALTGMERDPFPEPPTEADLADAFIHAALTCVRRPGAPLGPVLRGACDRLGWRSVAAVINTVGEAAQQPGSHVAAVLSALTSEAARV